MWRLSICLLLASLMSGCVTFSNVEKGSDLKMGPDEGIVIIGSPDNANLVFHSGDIKDGIFKADGVLPDGIIGKAESGYLVRKIKVTPAGRGYGLVYIQTNRHYSVGCNNDLAVLRVRPGEIQYFADFFVSDSGFSVGIQYKMDIEAAKEALKKNYPLNTIPVTQGELLRLHTGKCNPGQH